MTLDHPATPTITNRFFDTKDIRLHAVEYPGDGPSLILLPGLTSNARFFDAIVADGLASSATVIALDLRGRGLTDKPERGYAMADHAADVLGVLDALGIEQALLGGHSFGGLLACYMAANFPERVERLLILDSPFSEDRAAATRVGEQIGPSVTRLDQTWPDWQSFIASVQAQPAYADWWDPRIERYYRADVEEAADGSVRPRSRMAQIRQCIGGVQAVNWDETLTRVAQPTLFLRTTGQFGPAGFPPLMTREQAERALALLPDATYAEVSGNHMTAFFGESAREVAAAITSFLVSDLTATEFADADGQVDD